MPLAHFNNIDSSNKNWEPVHKNLFEINFELPISIMTPGIDGLLMENALTVDLPTYPELGVAEQRFKYSTRLYAMMPDTTSKKDISITFNLLKDEQHQIFVFRKLKDWYDLSWNNETGELNYKKATIGKITVNVHDKDGIIIRRVIYHNAVCIGFTGFESLDWSSVGELMNPLTVKFIADYWEDFYY